MVCDGRKSTTMPCRFRRAPGRCRVGLEQLDFLVTSASEQLPIPGPGHAFDHVLVSLRLPLFLSRCHVPHFDNAIATAGRKVFETGGILGKAVNTVDLDARERNQHGPRVYTVSSRGGAYMSRLEVAEEGLRKHALELCRIQSTRVLTCALEGVLGRVEVPCELVDVGAGRLRRRSRS